VTAVSDETTRAFDLIERIEALEGLAQTLSEQDERRSTLLRLIEKDLAAAPPLRPRIAAELLGLSEKTVRAWLHEGVLTRADGPTSRVLLDVQRVHWVLHLVKDLRAAGKTAGLLDAVYRRLVDATWLERDDLAQSLEQMHRGEGTVRGSKDVGVVAACHALSDRRRSQIARSPASAEPAAERTSDSSRLWPGKVAGLWATG